MTGTSLRRLLQDFGQQCGQADMALWNQPRLTPPLHLDSEFADLFRPEAEASVKDNWPGDEYRQQRWRRFIGAGCQRRRQSDGRRELMAELDRLRGGDSDLSADAAMELALALRDEGGAFHPAHPGGEEAVAGIEAARRNLEPWSRLHDGDDRLLCEALPADGHRDVWRRLTGPAGFLRPGDGQVVAHEAPASGCLAASIPGQIHLLMRSLPGLHAYDAGLQAAGEALALAHLPARLPAEDRWLPADGGQRIYGRLWARRLLSRHWLEAAGLRGEAVDTVVRAARSAQAERLLLLCEAGSDPLPAAAPGWGWLSTWPEEPAAALAGLAGLPPASDLLPDEQTAALLDHYLRRRWGYLWDTSRRAADLLRQLWSEGWARPLSELLSFLGEDDPHGEALLEDFASNP